MSLSWLHNFYSWLWNLISKRIQFFRDCYWENVNPLWLSVRSLKLSLQWNAIVQLLTANVHSNFIFLQKIWNLELPIALEDASHRINWYAWIYEADCRRNNFDISSSITHATTETPEAKSNATLLSHFSFLLLTKQTKRKGKSGV